MAALLASALRAFATRAAEEGSISPHCRINTQLPQAGARTNAEPEPPSRYNRAHARPFRRGGSLLKSLGAPGPRTSWHELAGDWIVPALAVLATGLLAAALCVPAEEDAFIYFRFALHAARGLGLVFNPGGRVEGFSSPLWMLLLGLGARLPVPVHALARGLGIAFAMATVAATGRLASAAGLGRAARLSVLTCLSLSFYFLLWAQSGLETPLYSLALVTATAKYLRTEYPLGEQRAERGDRWCAGLLLGLVCLARPEGLLLPLFGLVDRWRCGATRREIGHYAVPALALYGPYVLWRRSYFGTWLPNTSVKLYPLHFDRSLPQALELVVYLGGLVLFLPLVLLLIRSARRSLDGRRLGFVFAAGIGLSFGFHFAAGGDYRSGFRYMIPALPLLLTGGWGALDLWCRVPGRRRSAQILARSVLAASILVPSLDLLRRDPWYQMSFGRSPVSCWSDPFADTAQWGVAQSLWIVDHVPAGSLVAYGQMGKAPYLAALRGVDIRFLDTVGWVDRDVARIYRFDRKVTDLLKDLASGMGFAAALERGRTARVHQFVAEILRRRPDFVLVEPNLVHPGMDALEADPVFRRSYRHVADLAPAPIVRVYTRQRPGAP